MWKVLSIELLICSNISHNRVRSAISILLADTSDICFVDASGRQNALVASGCAKEDTTPRVMHDATTFNMITPSMDFERDRS